MSGTLLNLIIQLIAGAIGGNAAGNALKNYDLGMFGNSISGAIGGVAGGPGLEALVPLLAGSVVLPAARFCSRSFRCSRVRRAAWMSARCSDRPWAAALPALSSRLLSA